MINSNFSPLTKQLSNIILIAVVVLMVSGCLLTRDVTSEPKGRTDFIVGRVYRVKRPVFLFKTNRKDPKETAALAELGFSGTKKNLDEFRKEVPDSVQIAGLLMPGELIRVDKFMQTRVPDFGTFFNVFAVVDSGECKGKIVTLNLITKERRPMDHAFLDPEFLQLVDEGDKTVIPTERLLTITSNYIAEHHPSWTPELKLQPIILDHGDFWEVSFELPRDMAGGTPVVEISKRTYQVTKAYHTQ